MIRTWMIILVALGIGQSKGQIMQKIMVKAEEGAEEGMTNEQPNPSIVNEIVVILMNDTHLSNRSNDTDTRVEDNQREMFLTQIVVIMMIERLGGIQTKGITRLITGLKLSIRIEVKYQKRKELPNTVSNQQRNLNSPLLNKRVLHIKMRRTSNIMMMTYTTMNMQRVMKKEISIQIIPTRLNIENCMIPAPVRLRF
jgi:hypothetical protein